MKSFFPREGVLAALKRHFLAWQLAPAENRPGHRRPTRKRVPTNRD